MGYISLVGCRFEIRKQNRGIEYSLSMDNNCLVGKCEKFTTEEEDVVGGSADRPPVEYSKLSNAFAGGLHNSLRAISTCLLFVMLLGCQFC
jgi:hypothetical protein